MFSKEKRKIKEEQFNFSIVNEFRKCKYLNGVLGKSEEKYLKQSDKYSSYLEWERYVYNKYRNETKEHLYEFIKFLEHQKCTVIGIDSCRINFLIPFMTVLLGEFFVDSIKELIGSNIDFSLPVSIITNSFKQNATPWFGKMILILFGVGAILLVVLVILAALGIPLLYYLWEILRDLLRAEYKHAFYENYIRIIKGIMDNKVKECMKYEVYLSRID